MHLTFVLQYTSFLSSSTPSPFETVRQYFRGSAKVEVSRKFLKDWDIVMQLFNFRSLLAPLWETQSDLPMSL